MTRVLPTSPHLLVIRLSALGDVAMLVPVLRALVASYPEVKITVLSRNFFRPLFEEFPQVQFFEADVQGKHRGLFGLFRLASELSQLQITHIADVHNVLRSQILRKLIRCPKGGVRYIDKGRKEKKTLTRWAQKEIFPLKTTLERYVEVFQKLGFPISLQQPVFPTKKELPTLIQPEILPAKKIVGMAPFAAHSGKMYPLDLMEEVVQQLHQHPQIQLLFFGGGAQEVALLQNWANKYTSTINVAGRLSFADELAVISHLDAMLAMDSGNAHLAAIYGVPTITLWGVTHPFAGFYPYNQPLDNALLADREAYPYIPTSVYGNKFPTGYESAMRTIAVESVVQKVLQVVTAPK